MRTALLLLARLVCAVRGHVWLVSRVAPETQARDRFCSRCGARKREIPLGAPVATVKRLRRPRWTPLGVQLSKRGWAEIALRPRPKFSFIQTKVSKQDLVAETLRRMGA